jgi:hypothetical protein
MTRLAARVSVATVALVLMVAAPAALAKPSKRAYPDTAKGALRDCGAGHDPLEDSYSILVLQHALAGLSTENAQYSTCADALQAAIRADERPPPVHHHHHHRSTSTGTGPTKTTTTPTGGGHQKHHKVKPPPKPVDPITQRISAAETQGGKPQRIQGVDYTPGAITTRSSSLFGSIPTPILAVLAALLAGLVALGGLAIRNIVRARRTT